MNYEEARSRIQDGDLVLVRGKSDNLLRVLIKIVTNSPYTHAGVAVWLDNGLYMSEINGGGNHLIPMSQISDPFDVWECPVDRSLVRLAVLELLRDHKKYAIVELLRIALFIWLGVELPEKSIDKEFVCNEYAARTYSLCGWDASIFGKVFWPGVMAEVMGPIKVRVEQ